MAQGDDHTDVVTAVKDQLVAQGEGLSGPCGAFKITLGTVWALSAHEPIGLVAKRDDQEGCTYKGARYAVDAAMYPDGTTYDMLINSQTENRPAWQVTGAQPPSAWRAPVDPGDPVDPPVESDVDDALRQLHGSIDAMEAAVVRLETEWDTGGNPPDADTAAQILDAANRVDQLTARVEDVLNS